MRHTQLLSGALVWLVLALASTAPVWGQDVAQPAWRGRPALASRGHPGLALPGHGGSVAFQMPGRGALATKEQGQDALATAGVLHEPAGRSGGPVQPITVEHQGRLLVLTYGPKPSAGGLVSFTDPRGEPPRFAVYQGQRQIASGQFEYG
jgi:hypothetical protein